MNHFKQAHKATKAEMTIKIIHFNEMDVEVSQDDYIGHWQAWEAGTYDCDCDQDGYFVTCPIGSGSTMLEAIADLAEVLEARQ